MEQFRLRNALRLVLFFLLLLLLLLLHLPPPTLHQGVCNGRRMLPRTSGTTISHSGGAFDGFSKNVTVSICCASPRAMVQSLEYLFYKFFFSFSSFVSCVRVFVSPSQFSRVLFFPSLPFNLIPRVIPFFSILSFLTT